MSAPSLIERLRELAERCEQATGPDRELDAAIFNWMRDNAGLVPSRSHLAYPFYAFTESLDAAMTLVPEGYGWWLYRYETPQGSQASVAIPEEALTRCYSKTPALALCATALRARAALHHEGADDNSKQS